MLMPGSRVQFHPATDQWMSGERFATVLDHYSHTNAYRVQTDYGNIYVVSESFIY